MENDIKKKVFFLSIGGYISVINKHLSESYPLEPLGKHIKVLGGYAFKSAEYKEEGIPIIRISDFNNEKIDLSSVKYYDESPECDKYELKEGEIIIALTGGTIGKLGIVQKELGKLYLNQRVGKFEVLKPAEFFDRYVYWIARGVQDRVKNLGYGGAQPNISGKQIESMEFPIPKKDEQIGIVNFLKDLRDGNIQDKEYFNKETETEIIKLQKIQEDIFTGTQNLNLQFEDIQKLRQSILSEAVQGKLVMQDLKDEPASVLLEKIKKEKDNLIKEKKIRKSNKLPKINESDLGFILPKNWTLVRIGDISYSIVPNRDKPKSFSGGYPWITLPSFNRDSIELNLSKSSKGLSKEEIIKYNARVIPKNHVVMSCVGNFGLAAVVPQDIVVNQQIHCFVLLGNIIPEFVAYVIKSQKTYLEEKATSTTIKYLNKTNCESLPFCLPPLNEQKRIVEKVGQLIKLCDELEEQVKNNQTNSELLMEVVLREAFESGAE
jgi:type I restriction enzyme, S subunit